MSAFPPVADTGLPRHGSEMAKRRPLCIVGAMAVVAGCHTLPSAIGASVFQNPAQFLGQSVRVCGYLIGPANILQRRNDVNVGLSIDGGVHARELAQLAERAPVCLAGIISYIGCDTDPKVICTDAAFDYMMHVAEIL